MSRDFKKHSKSGSGNFTKKRRTTLSNKTSEKPYPENKKSFDKPFEKYRRTDSEKPSEGYDSSDKKNSYRKPFQRDSFRKPFKRTYDKPTNNKVSSENKDGLIRLNRYIANAGICSRREADDLIKSGVVAVNGKVITEMGFKVSPGDIVKYGGETLKREKMVYVLLNKPKDYITTVDDPEGRKTVLSLVQDACTERIYPVGRLDRNTTGLLLLTNDGELTKKLTHPRYGIKKIYHVVLDKVLKQSDLDIVTNGIELEDGFIKPDKISYVADGNDKKEIGIEIHSGRNRIVRRIFEQLGYNIRKLDRVYFAGLTKKDLPKGRWRILTEAEIGILKMTAG